MVGSRISHYLLEERIGQGGMGEVFLARDLALDRAAAIKLLPESFSPELRRRLLREAAASRRLQHPGIATFYEAGEVGGRAFIAMEYVRGDTLRARLRSGPLDTKKALALVTGLLEALGHAHAAGVIHRDIKPENVMVTGEGTAKLLDFGLARELAADGADRERLTALTRTALTEPGAILGTLGYMAPEQLGGRPTDARTDLFAVGAVMYEMLAGRAAFGGDNAAARIAATLFGEPPALPEESASVQAIVRRALARDPEARYASTAEFLRDLRLVGEGRVVASQADTVAVLDFTNRSGDPGDGWIGSGIAESLTADLSRFEGLGVVPRARIGKALEGLGEVSDPSVPGQRLGCRWVISGSVQRMGPALRLLMQLTHVPTARATASEKLDGRLEDLFSLQDRLGELAARALQVERRAEATPERAVPALAAYECCVRGRQQWLRMTKAGFDQAQELFEEAIRQEPDYAEAFTGLAGVHDMRFTFTTDPAELERAVTYARGAIERAPRQADAHVWLAYGSWRLGRIEDALAAARRAGELDPANVYPPYFSAAMLMSLGRHEEAIPLYQRAVKLGPTFGFAWVGLGNAFMELERFEEAMWSLDKGVELESRLEHATAGADGYAGECLRRQGRLDPARRRCLAGLEAAERSDHMYRDSFRATCLCALGRVALDQDDREAARAAFRQCELQLEGRRATLGGGWFMVQALSGRAAADRDEPLYEEARARLEARSRLDWSWQWLATEEVAAEHLARAAAALGREDEATAWRARARGSGGGVRRSG